MPPGPGGELLTIGQGDQLAVDVANHVRRQALAAQFDPDAVNLARRVVTMTSRRDHIAYCDCIRATLGRCFLFVEDPRDGEAIKSVGEMARDIDGEGVTRGDCEECAALAAGLGLCVGIPMVRLVLEAHYRADEPYEHIFAELWDGVSWRDMNVTPTLRERRTPIGRHLIVEV